MVQPQQGQIMVPILDLGAVAPWRRGGECADAGRLRALGLRQLRYTMDASLTDRRIGFNMLEAIEAEKNGDGQLFRYTFHDPDDPRSLGNGSETIIDQGDSGGPVLVGGGKSVDSTMWRAC